MRLLCVYAQVLDDESEASLPRATLRRCRGVTQIDWLGVLEHLVAPCADSLPADAVLCACLRLLSAPELQNPSLEFLDRVSVLAIFPTRGALFLLVLFFFGSWLMIFIFPTCGACFWFWFFCVCMCAQPACYAAQCPWSCRPDCHDALCFVALCRPR